MSARHNSGRSGFKGKASRRSRPGGFEGTRLTWWCVRCRKVTKQDYNGCLDCGWLR